MKREKWLLAMALSGCWGMANASAIDNVNAFATESLKDSLEKEIKSEMPTTALGKQTVNPEMQTPASEKQTTKFEKRDFTDSKLYQMTFVGTPLIVTGFIMKGEDTHFRSLRNDYAEEFHRPFDNYTQYMPAAVMLGMKAFGVKGRSDWGRMLASDIMSAAIMASVVQSMKHTTNVMRPDGSDNHSFPSGHTATAFMTATMLTKEYGHISPWIGIGAYTFATSTGLMRIANNKHWLSDVLTGAGIGIISTEVGYYLADLIFKEKGIHHFATNDIFSRYDKPSFLGLYLGVNIPLSHYDINEDHAFRTSSGSSAGIEGAYFFNPYIGAGGRFAVSNTHIITNTKEQVPRANDEKKENATAEDNTFDAVTAMAGPYVSYPLTSRWLIGSKLLAGYVGYNKLTLSDGTVVPHKDGVGFGSGLSISYKAKERYGIRFFLDYNLLPSHSKHSGEWMNTLAIGSTFGMHF